MKITNNGASAIVLPCGTSVKAGETAEVEKLDEKHPVVAGLMKSGALTTDAAPADPAKSESKPPKTEKPAKGAE